MFFAREEKQRSSLFKPRTSIEGKKVPENIEFVAFAAFNTIPYFYLVSRVQNQGHQASSLYQIVMQIMNLNRKESKNCSMKFYAKNIFDA